MLEKGGAMLLESSLMGWCLVPIYSNIYIYIYIFSFVVLSIIFGNSSDISRSHTVHNREIFVRDM